MTPFEAQLLFARILVIALLYTFVGAVGLIGWLDLRRAGRAGARTAPSPARLVVIEGAQSDWPPGTAFGLEPVSVVGRDLEADVVMGDPTLSGRHALVTHREGAWWIEDLGSTNGTFLNGARLPAQVPAIARSGDVIQVGAVRMRLAIPD